MEKEVPQNHVKFYYTVHICIGEIQEIARIQTKIRKIKEKLQLKILQKFNMDVKVKYLIDTKMIKKKIFHLQ